MSMVERWATDDAYYAARRPIVDQAERDLRIMIGADGDRADAARFPVSWERYGELTASEVSDLLSRFGPMPGETP
jgi:hypothetical protein